MRTVAKPGHSHWPGVSVRAAARAGGVVAVYPSPAGGTESSPMPEAWSALVEAQPRTTSVTSCQTSRHWSSIGSMGRVRILRRHRLMSRLLARAAWCATRWRHGFTGGRRLVERESPRTTSHLLLNHEQASAQPELSDQRRPRSGLCSDAADNVSAAHHRRQTR